MWYYKYDALGRRILKECPQQQLRIEYLWDGDQLAYTQTFKKSELVSERHSVFNGFELIAQQDNYQTLKQTIDGNFIEWKFETNYSIVQPNGKVLGLLAPNGKLSWRAQNKSLWGLSFSQYNFNSNLDPNLLFAGQYYDEESGLAYNRFRYYDPENGNYICSDPIGLDGGETPYFYTHNPEDITDSFGLTSWLDIVKSQGVTPKTNVINPHGHHIIFKGSFSEIPNMRSALDRSIKIANKYDVPLNFDKKNIIGRSNLMIASNTKDVHTVKNAEKIASLLEKADKRASKWMDLGIMNKKQASSYINKEIIRAGGKVFGKYGIKKCKS
ncbi:RHS repeat-associated core domain-containing protein [Pasteurella sp. WM03]|nr:RHS repeat-associated core domain-containing protein [Pasteurella sp. 19428wF3_WM03]TFU50988.1 RHS repeat-associated core domain-containing protein [Pasteurella sp. WM03]